MRACGYTSCMSACDSASQRVSFRLNCLRRKSSTEKTRVILTIRPVRRLASSYRVGARVWVRCGGLGLGVWLGLASGFVLVLGLVLGPPHQLEVELVGVHVEHPQLLLHRPQLVHPHILEHPKQDHCERSRRVTDMSNGQ